jgi:SNF2 family DNA or RNA helicase
MQLASDVHYSIDLTAATRAYMLEPQWNPTVEDQAMARIHRIGQTRPVTTIRYIMEDSIEEVKAMFSLYSSLQS